MNILITGSASHLAGACLPQMFDDPRVTKVTGLDLKPAMTKHPAFHSHVADIRDPAIEHHFRNAEAVIHLAFINQSGVLGKQRCDREYIRSVNVAGTQHVCQLAARHGVNTLVYLSSAIVYGLSGQNPQFMREDQPLHAVEGFYFAEDKVAVEQWLDQFEARQRTLRIVRLRPHFILGPHSQPLLKALLRQPFHLNFRDPQPLLQGVADVDVAGAMRQALFSDARGAFNLATDQVASFYLIQKHLHRYSPALPFSLARTLHQLAWRYSGSYGDPGWFDGMRHSLTIANDKAKQELHWSPTLDLFECLDGTL